MEWLTIGAMADIFTLASVALAASRFAPTRRLISRDSTKTYIERGEMVTVRTIMSRKLLARDRQLSRPAHLDCPKPSRRARRQRRSLPCSRRRQEG